MAENHITAHLRPRATVLALPRIDHLHIESLSGARYVQLHRLAQRERHAAQGLAALRRALGLEGA
jgi:hypothetical protein